MAYSEDHKRELFAKMCDELASGRSLNSICRDPGMPTKPTFLAWMRDDADLFNQYTRARDAQVDHFVDELVDLADSAEDAALAKLQIDTRKWVACKQRPKKYGDKVDVEHTGPDGGPVQMAMTVKLVRADQES